jgi:hypothetical protein
LESFEGFVKRVVEGFNAFGLDYMFTGALAVSYYGRARMTGKIFRVFGWFLTCF